MAEVVSLGFPGVGEAADFMTCLLHRVLLARAAIHAARPE
jgi:hypothetical protein